jgi:hypothetical protein
MKGFNLSLKYYLAGTVLLIGVGLVVGYTFLAGSFFREGIDTYIVSQMDGVAKNYRQQPALFEQSPLDDLFYVSSDWQALPGEFQRSFSAKDIESNRLYKHKIVSEERASRRILFLLKATNGDQLPVYVGKSMKPSEVPQIGRQKAGRSFTFLHVTGGVILVVLIVVLFLLLKSLGRPIERLGQWARSVSPETVKEPLPDFRYRELNQLAALIQQGLQQTHATLEREQQFLNYASHELRTPISVMRNNIELLYRMDNERSEAETRVLNRLYRAGLTMTDLIDTLLWLSREEVEAIPVAEVHLDNEVMEAVNSLRYLTEGKPVTLHVDTEPFVGRWAKVPCQIVLTNMVRNAFQHSWEGGVTIRQTQAMVEIRNRLVKAEDGREAAELGFGLGLFLIEKLCRQFGWGLQTTMVDGEHVTRVDFESSALKESEWPNSSSEDTA